MPLTLIDLRILVYDVGANLFFFVSNNITLPLPDSFGVFSVKEKQNFVDQGKVFDVGVDWIIEGITEKLTIQNDLRKDTVDLSTEDLEVGFA